MANYKIDSNKNTCQTLAILMAMRIWRCNAGRIYKTMKNASSYLPSLLCSAIFSLEIECGCKVIENATKNLLLAMAKMLSSDSIDVIVGEIIDIHVSVMD